MTYEVRIDVDAADFLNSQDEKTQSIIKKKKNLAKLREEPYPSPEAQSGDREKVTVNGEEVYRMHISRSYTAFYIVKEEEEQLEYLRDELEKHDEPDYTSREFVEAVLTKTFHEIRSKTPGVDPEKVKFGTEDR